MVDPSVDRLEVAARLVGRTARERRSGLHRRLRVDDGRQRLEVDGDELRRVLCRRLALRDDDRNRLAREDDLLAGERLRGAVGGRARGREVGSRQHRDDSGHLARGVGVDPADERVGLGREN
ncbi:MAG: hypothetical protein KatS3mg012_2499 [Gaiellaceae bacterium]|nr:MAG: hypothetical protein KatS3mg012_2499 [Gaiellaceae bacterium]